MKTFQRINKSTQPLFQLVMASALAWGLVLSPSSAFGASEKGPRCNDGIDNDGDGLIDCDDPDCNCGEGDGGDGGVVCVEFDDFPEHSLQSDGDGGYCHDQKNKVSVTFTNDGHLIFDPNASAKTNTGRRFFVDFGTPISIVDSEGVEWEFQTTDELESLGIDYDINLQLGAFQDDFNMLEMILNEERTDINLTMTMAMQFPGQQQGAVVFIKLAPSVLDNGRHCEASDSVSVTCTAVDASDNPIAWRVETRDPDNDGCVSQDPFGLELGDLMIGLRNLSFAFTVTK